MFLMVRGPVSHKIGYIKERSERLHSPQTVLALDASVVSGIILG